MNKISLPGEDILSLFDGMSCGQISLNDLCIPYNKYYASETDKFAIKVTNANFPNTIQLGDINNWKQWNIDWKNIKLILAGSPCQGFSFAGKQLNFNDPRSALFFVFVDILNHVKKMNPEVKFLLENVRMKKEYLRIISEHVGVFPVNINSNLLSAQNRNRFYWTNIKTRAFGLFKDELVSDIPQPKDKGILLKDILQPENEVDEKYYLKEKTINNLLDWGKRNKANGNGFKPEFKTGNQKSTALTTGSMKSSSTFIKLDKQLNEKSDQHKAACLTGGGNSGGNHSDMDIICVAMRGRNPKNSNDRKSEYTEDYKLRRLTPIECERLQTVPDNYTNHVSNTQRYKMLGNGWTVNIISSILKFLK